jgi:hypothetical protein
VRQLVPYSLSGICEEERAEGDSFVLFLCESSSLYRPRNPEECVLYGVMAGHLETFLARQRERGRTVPRFVERERREVCFVRCLFGMSPISFSWLTVPRE